MTPYIIWGIVFLAFIAVTRNIWGFILGLLLEMGWFTGIVGVLGIYAVWLMAQNQVPLDRWFRLVYCLTLGWGDILLSHYTGLWASVCVP